MPSPNTIIFALPSAREAQVKKRLTDAMLDIIARRPPRLVVTDDAFHDADSVLKNRGDA